MDNIVNKAVDAASNIAGKTADAAVSAGKGAVKAGGKAVDATVGAAKGAGDKTVGAAKNVGAKTADAASAGCSTQSGKADSLGSPRAVTPSHSRLRPRIAFGGALALAVPPAARRQRHATCRS